MNTIEVELWNIFTCYTLHGSPRDPSRMNETQFLKLCKDSSVMNPTMVDIPLNQATLHLIWTSEQKNSKVTYLQTNMRIIMFLNCHKISHQAHLNPIVSDIENFSRV